MKFARWRILSALIMIILATATGARALVFIVDDEPEPALERVTSNLTRINFGSVEVGSQSKTVSLKLTNDDEINETTVSQMLTTDGGVKYSDDLDTPFTIPAGGSVTKKLHYNNTETLTTVNGVIAVTFSIAVGTEDLLIPFTVNGVEEGALMEKPDEGFFLGPCFLDTLTSR